MTSRLIAAFCCVIATVSVSAQHPVLSVTPPASPPAIDLENRRNLAAGNRTAQLGSITITETTAPNPAREEDGATDFVPDNRGHSEMNLSVFGPLRQGDAVFLDLDANGAPDPGEELRINPSSGSASAGFSLDVLAPGGRAIHYMPNGNDMMERGEFVISATVDYDESLQADPDDLSWRTPLQYHGVSAIAVFPRPTGVLGEDPHIRVRCASGGPSCVLFFECRDQGPDADYFFDKIGTIEDEWTIRLSPYDFSNILSVRDWTERPSCHLLSDKPLEVLVKSGLPRPYF